MSLLIPLLSQLASSPLGEVGRGLLFIHWNPDVIAFSIGSFGVRWYSLCWCIGLLTVFLLEQRLFKEQKIPDEKFDPLFLYSFLGILIGARLGHCIFYEPEYFLSSPAHMLEMILPMKQGADGAWHFTGYTGLASHGGTLMFIVALWFYSRRTKVPFLTALDNIAIVTPICAAAIRLGNLMNSEIIGKPTDVPWAFIFERVDQLPRHPGQLYEALAYLLFFFIGWWFYRRRPERVGTGFFFGLCIFLIFTFRFFIEYTKEVQVSFENGMLFNMGQLLSVPFVLLGAYFIWRGSRSAKSNA
ncbi:MAG: prolipoprotein diacylglyceryl transferase [Bacteroidaceae bacterium]|nr:prolipoprotein diacylglyceryl transferase [Bacteroidaceae bacterium]